MNWGLAKNLEDIFEQNMPLTRTSEARVINQKACRGFRGAVPLGGVGVVPEHITRVKRKIDHISKTKNRTKKTRKYKKLIRKIAHLLRCPKKLGQLKTLENNEKNH